MAFFVAGASAVYGAGLGDAAGLLTDAGTSANLSNKSDIGSTIKVIVGAILALVGTIFLIMMVYAGFLWITAAGNSEQAEKGKTIIAQSVIGLIITLAAFAITNFVGNKLAQPGTQDTGSAGTDAQGGCCVVNGEYYYSPSFEHCKEIMNDKHGAGFNWCLGDLDCKQCKEEN